MNKVIKKFLVEYINNNFILLRKILLKHGFPDVVYRAASGFEN